MRFFLSTTLCCSLLAGVNTSAAEESADVVETPLQRVISYESHPIKNEGQSHHAPRIPLQYRLYSSTQEDHSSLSGAELSNMTGLTDGIDQEDVVLEFIKPLESEPRALPGGNSMSVLTLFSRFSSAQLQSAAALRLLEKYPYNPSREEKPENFSKQNKPSDIVLMLYRMTQ